MIGKPTKLVLTEIFATVTNAWHSPTIAKDASTMVAFFVLGVSNIKP